VILSDGHCKVEEFGGFTSYQSNGYRVSFLGDTHPIFHGSVVKAVACGKRTYGKIVDLFGDRVTAIGSQKEYELFADTMRHLFRAYIVKVTRLSPTALELQVHSPIAARNFKPGHFYRLQNFESFAPLLGETRLLSEGVALIGARVDQENGNLFFIVLEQGASSRIFATLRPGDPVSLMGPTGVRSKIPKDHEVVMIIGGRMAVAHLLAIGPTLKQANNRILFVGIFEHQQEVIYRQQLEAIADSIVWITQTGDPVPVHRSSDFSNTGEVMSVLLDYAMNAKANQISLESIHRIHVVGTHRLIKLFQSAKETLLKNRLKTDTQIVASIYGPMQCMLKGVCAQCLQWQVDPKTGQRTKAVFACSWQDQSIDVVDLDNLNERLSQNQMQEALTNLWLDYLFEYHEIARA
jgi:NAD(P)H-flavin reductase